MIFEEGIRILTIMARDKKKIKETPDSSFDQIMKALLSVEPKENSDIKEKARKERKKEGRKSRKE